MRDNLTVNSRAFRETIAFGERFQRLGSWFQRNEPSRIEYRTRSTSATRNRRSLGPLSVKGEIKRDICRNRGLSRFRHSEISGNRSAVPKNRAAVK